MPKLPFIPESEQTPTVKALLGLLEECVELIQKQNEEIQQLKDEVRVLKGEKKRPTFKPSKLDKETNKADFFVINFCIPLGIENTQFA